MDSTSSCLKPSSHISHPQLHLQSQQRISDPHQIQVQGSHIDSFSSSPHFQDDFLDQMLLSALPSSPPWPDISPAAACPCPGTDHHCFGFDDPEASVLPPGMESTLLIQLQQQQQQQQLSPSIRLTDSQLFADHHLPSQSFDHPQEQSFVRAHTTAAAMDRFAAAAGTGSGRGGAAPGQTKQRVRARRGMATDPHSIAERLRRERIAERLKGLQELVPNANKTDKASMLDEIIDYVKFLQLQVKVLSMSRMGGGAAAVSPLVADISTEAKGGGQRVISNGGQAIPGTNDGDILTVAEQHVVKMMEEDMGSAMQYLLGKGLCLMPISLATAISSRGYPLHHPSAATDRGPSSPIVSALTVQSAADPSTSVPMS